MKILKFRTKMCFLRIFGLNFKNLFFQKYIAIIDVSTLKIFKTQIFVQNKNSQI